MLHCLTVGWLPAAALAVPPPPAQTAPPGTAAPDAAAPNDDLLEFLGGDDVGDAAWWEFLNKSRTPKSDLRRPAPPASPPLPSETKP